MPEIYSGMSAAELHRVTWQKSRRSNSQGNCVEMARLPGDAVALRNSRHPNGPALVYTRAEIEALILGAKDGDFDNLLPGGLTLSSEATSQPEGLHRSVTRKGEPPVRMAFPHYVFDAYHQLIGTFDNADDAHQFAHNHSREPTARLPIEVEDRSSRTSRLVWPDRCQSVRWMAIARVDPCVVYPQPMNRDLVAANTLQNRRAG